MFMHGLSFPRVVGSYHVTFSLSTNYCQWDITLVPRASYIVELDPIPSQAAVVQIRE